MSTVWRYEAPAGVWHYVTRDPAAIKRPGTPGVWMAADAASLAQMRERITVAAAQLMAANRLPGDVADAVMRELFGDTT